MPILRKCSSLVGAIDRELLSHLSATKMKIGKAPLLLKKAVTVCKSKTSVLRSRLLVLGLLRRKIAMVTAISDRIYELMVVNDSEKARVDSHMALVKKAIHGGEIVDISVQLELFDQEKDSRTHWTVHPLFNDDDDNTCCYTDDREGDSDGQSVVDVIRSSREAEFNMEDDIDQASEMFIRKFREQYLNITF